MEKYCQNCQKRVDRYCTFLDKFVARKFSGKENLAESCKKYQPKKARKE